MNVTLNDRHARHSRVSALYFGGGLALGHPVLVLIFAFVSRVGLASRPCLDTNTETNAPHPTLTYFSPAPSKLITLIPRSCDAVSIEDVRPSP